MKLATIIITIILSSGAMAGGEKLLNPMPKSLIRHYQKMHTQERMIAGNKEKPVRTVNRKPSWSENLRAKLQTTNGKIRL